MLMQDPNIATAVIFGQGQLHCGVLVEPAQPFEVGSQDSEEVIRFKSMIRYSGDPNYMLEYYLIVLRFNCVGLLSIA